MQSFSQFYFFWIPNTGFFQLHSSVWPIAENLLPCCKTIEREPASKLWVACERERESVCVCVRERERECVCVCVRERERERECVCVWERERERVCVCVCVRERERGCLWAQSLTRPLPEALMDICPMTDWLTDWLADRQTGRQTQEGEALIFTLIPNPASSICNIFCHTPEDSWGPLSPDFLHTGVSGRTPPGPFGRMGFCTNHLLVQ
jgi:hypothetical protein